MPNTTGSVAIVTVTTTSASLKASSSESMTFTSSPPTSSAHLQRNEHYVCLSKFYGNILFLYIIIIQIKGYVECVLDSFCLCSPPDAYLAEFVACPHCVHMTPSLYTAANNTQHRGRAGNKSLKFIKHRLIIFTEKDIVDC